MKLTSIIFFLVIFYSCSETSQTMDGIETYELQSQTVEIRDTTFKLDANGNPTSEIDNIN